MEIVYLPTWMVDFYGKCSLGDPWTRERGQMAQLKREV